MIRMVELFRTLSGYPRLGALALGAIAALGFEPIGWWPAALLALALLIPLIANASSAREACRIGWLFGLGHFIFGNNWIATAFTYQANMPQWLGWIAVVLLAAYLAVYPMLAVLGAWLARRNRLAMVLAFAGYWIITEWLRSWVFTGYVWNPLAMVALGPFDRPGLAALAPFTGTYGLSGIVILLGGLWAAALWRARADWRTAAAALAPILLMLQPGARPDPLPANGLPYTLVQPDIRQDDLDDADKFAGQLGKTARLSTPAVSARKSASEARQARLVLWPESGMPYYLQEGYPRHLYWTSSYEADPLMVRGLVGDAIGPDSLLLTGAVDLAFRKGEVDGARNVITAIAADGSLKGSYAKAHLVPYGEYLPLRWLLEPLGASRLVPGSLDFLPGPGPRTLDLGAWGKAGMQICYEIIFSGQVVDRRNRPDYIFNPSNDGWFGSFGPPQHLAQARMRAIEEGLPVLRATTTGISAVIDGEGIVRQDVPRHVAARRDGILPAALAPTPFARAGNALPLVLSVVLLILSLVAMRRTRR